MHISINISDGNVHHVDDVVCTVMFLSTALVVVFMSMTSCAHDFSSTAQVVIFIMMMTVISIISAIIAVYLDGRSDASRVPRWLRVVAFQGLARVFCLYDKIPKLVGASQIEPKRMDVEDVREPPDTIDTEQAADKPATSELGKILENLKFLTNYVKDQQQAESIIDEWKLLSKVIDRTLFWLCLIVTVIYVIVTVASLAHYRSRN